MVKWNEILRMKNLIDPNILVLLVGRSGSGKTTLEKMLVEIGFKSVKSYTTRPKRTEDEDNHTFVSKEEFDALENKIAYTNFNGYEYCATKEQLDNATVYVIDPAGVEYLKQSGYDRELFIVYLETWGSTCMTRMLDRGDDYDKAKQRIANDEREFALFGDKADVKINANKDSASVHDKFLDIYGMMRLCRRIDELESEVEIWKNLSQRLP